jgi:hypothetical protein
MEVSKEEIEMLRWILFDKMKTQPSNACARIENDSFTAATPDFDA